jgi:hypothetical protein
MNHDSASAYGLWWLVIINIAVFVIFAFSFAKPQSRRDWRSRLRSQVRPAPGAVPQNRSAGAPGGAS